MWIDVFEGSHLVRVEFRNTPPRAIGNTISLFTWVGLSIFLFWRRIGKNISSKEFRMVKSKRGKN